MPVDLLHKAFDVGFIDEAGQILSDAAIPLGFYMKPKASCVLAGDVAQLPPPTMRKWRVLSALQASSVSYPSVLLKVQYRSVSPMSDLTSFVFYKGAVENGDLQKTENLQTHACQCHVRDISTQRIAREDSCRT